MNSLRLDYEESLRRIPALIYFAWGDTRARYKRSILGPLWLVIGTAIAVTGLGFLWSAIFKIDAASLVPSLTVGLVIWQFLAGCITESASIFSRNASLLRNIKTPYLSLPLQLLFRNLINLAHNLIIVAIVLIIFPPAWSLRQLLVLPGLFLVIGNLFWISLSIGILGARFRDLEPLISALMPLLFFLSPVIFNTEQLGAREQLSWINPFSYMICLIKQPLRGESCPVFVYMISSITMVAGIAFSFWLLNLTYRRIAFWI